MFLCAYDLPSTEHLALREAVLSQRWHAWQLYAHSSQNGMMLGDDNVYISSCLVSPTYKFTILIFSKRSFVNL